MERYTRPYSTRYPFSVDFRGIPINHAQVSARIGTAPSTDRLVTGAALTELSDRLMAEYDVSKKALAIIKKRLAAAAKAQSKQHAKLRNAA